MITIDYYDNLELSRQALEVVKSRFLLCMPTTKRTHQLEKGAQPAIEAEPEEYSSPKTFFTLALREIIEGNMDLEQTGEE